MSRAYTRPAGGIPPQESARPTLIDLDVVREHRVVHYVVLLGGISPAAKGDSDTLPFILICHPPGSGQPDARNHRDAYHGQCPALHWLSSLIFAGYSTTGYSWRAPPVRAPRNNLTPRNRVYSAKNKSPRFSDSEKRDPHFTDRSPLVASSRNRRPWCTRMCGHRPTS
jgi:hypothetical protein